MFQPTPRYQYYHQFLGVCPGIGEKTEQWLVNLEHAVEGEVAEVVEMESNNVACTSTYLFICKIEQEREHSSLEWGYE